MWTPTKHPGGITITSLLGHEHAAGLPHPGAHESRTRRWLAATGNLAAAGLAAVC